MTITINPVAVVTAVLMVLLRVPGPALAAGGGVVLAAGLLTVVLVVRSARPATVRSRR